MNIIMHRLAAVLGFAALAATAGCATHGHYLQRNLVSDIPAIPAEHHDPQLVNSWGVAFNPFGFAWVADNGTGVATLYDGDGNKQSLVVTIPAATAGATGTPTGITFYGGAEFVVTQGKLSGPARFMFASEDGVISAWAPNVDATHALRVAGNDGAVYKGITVSATGNGARLYAADFHNARVDVFDGAFNPVLLAGAFADHAIPHGYAPFGIQNIGGDIYVSYAKQDAARHDDVKGMGFGFVDVYDPEGRLVRRLVSRGDLNAPWGMALAPASFGRFANRLLVGNFGDGKINAYDIDSGEWKGRLQGPNRKPIQIDGLWGIAFGNGLQDQPTNTLFFASGPNGEADGLYGRLDVAPKGK
ncbi:TIGR03118 family protein [Massilia terrae]|uniref:TIGR03118 family protein n=1 Tax=Massilia terrae TaxID=1811224 RepID=A0ABT2CT28_9BURK|nr:TIGR03118 family protein [Massilia terrae]MCS0657099.1 TIGR03118 family protein [Massilia terrae]